MAKGFWFSISLYTLLLLDFTSCAVAQFPFKTLIAKKSPKFGAFDSQLSDGMMLGEKQHQVAKNGQPNIKKVEHPRPASSSAGSSIRSTGDIWKSPSPHIKYPTREQEQQKAAKELARLRKTSWYRKDVKNARHIVRRSAYFRMPSHGPPEGNGFIQRGGKTRTLKEQAPSKEQTTHGYDPYGYPTLRKARA